MSVILSILIDGIAYGMILFMISVGLSVVMGLMRVINLAHGGVRADRWRIRPLVSPSDWACPLSPARSWQLWPR